MRYVGYNLDRAFFLQRGSGLAQGAGGIDQIIHDHAGAAGNITDDVHDARFVRLRTALVDDRQLGIGAPFRYGAGAADPAAARRQDGTVTVLATSDFPGQPRSGYTVVARDMEDNKNT